MASSDSLSMRPYTARWRPWKRCVGPLVGDEVHLAHVDGAGVGAEILVEQRCNGTGIRHHAGVAVKAVGLAHVGHAHEHRRLGQDDVGTIDLQEGHHQLCDGGDVHIRLDIVLEHQRQLVQDVGHAHGAGTLEQAGVEIALHIQAIDVRVGVASPWRQRTKNSARRRPDCGSP